MLDNNKQTKPTHNGEQIYCSFDKMIEDGYQIQISKARQLFLQIYMSRMGNMNILSVFFLYTEKAIREFFLTRQIK